MAFFLNPFTAGFDRALALNGYAGIFSHGRADPYSTDAEVNHVNGSSAPQTPARKVPWMSFDDPHQKRPQFMENKGKPLS